MIELMVAGVIAAAEPSADELERAMSVLATADQARLMMDADDVQLSRAISELGEQLPVPLRADWNALASLGVYPDTRIAVRLRGVSGLAGLGSMALGLGDEFDRPVFETDGSGLVLTTVNGAATMRVTGVYDVRDLLANSALVAHLRETSPAAKIIEEPAEDSESDDEVESPSPQSQPAEEAPRSLTPGEQLVLLITDHVDPEAWMNFGGARGRISERNGLILLTAAPMVHWRFRNALERLRAVDPRSVAIDAVIVELPRETFERLSKLHSAGSPSLAAALKGDSSATVLWRSGVPAMVKQPLKAQSKTHDQAVSVEVMPSVDQESGTLSVTVQAEVALPNDQRSVQSTAMIKGDNFAIPFELPAAGATPEVRMLVLTIRRK